MITENENAKKQMLEHLNRRAYTRGELFKKLNSLGCCESSVNDALDWAEQRGLIDDLEYARSLVRKFIKRGYGKQRIIAEFIKRDINRSLWDQALLEAEEYDAAASAAAYVRSHFRGEQLDYAERRRLLAALSRRGFDYEVSKNALQILLAQNLEDEGDDDDNLSS